MVYPNGEPVRIGDTLECWPGCIGVVVASMDTGEYTTSHSETDWAYLKHGIMIETDNAGLIHYEAQGIEMKLISRAPA